MRLDKYVLNDDPEARRLIPVAPGLWVTKGPLWRKATLEEYFEVSPLWQKRKGKTVDDLVNQREVIVQVGRRKYCEELDLEYYGQEETTPLAPFHINDMNQYNGKHFIFGWLECFLQSDDVPMWVREAQNVYIEVK